MLGGLRDELVQCYVPGEAEDVADLRPTLAFVDVIALLNAVTQVDHVFVLTKGGPSDSTNLLLFYVYQQAVESYDIGKASAATVISLAGLLAITFSALGTLEQSFGGGGE